MPKEEKLIRVHHELGPHLPNKKQPSRMTIYLWRKQGLRGVKLRTRRFGHDIFVTESDLREFLAKTFAPQN